MSAIISECGQYRYRLEREVQEYGKVFAYFGVNPSTADANSDDPTIRKMIGFTKRNGGRRLIVGNVFAYRAKDVVALAAAEDAFGKEIDVHVKQIIYDADILVPCWGRTSKVPVKLRFAFDNLLDELVASGKPIYHLGYTKCGNPKHPLMPSYATPLQILRK